MPGVHPATGELRWTFDWPSLNAGLGLIPVLIGLFAIGKILTDLFGGERQVERTDCADSPWLTLNEWKAHAKNLLRSSGIGTVIGVPVRPAATVGLAAAAHVLFGEHRRSLLETAVSRKLGARRTIGRSLGAS